MRNKLQKFGEFAAALLPHETAYLLSIQQFEDDVKLNILQLMHENCGRIRQQVPYDTEIDKRKYSNLKGWIEEHLSAIDVDERFDWLSRTERKIMTDAIEPQEEKSLLKAIREYEQPDFYFMKFFELVQFYRHYLLIRMRHAHHRLTDDFLKRFQMQYNTSKEVFERMHEATQDIVNQYSKNSAQSIHWENWLTEVFYNEALDGLNRYFALVRLTFIYFNYRNFEKLLEKYEYIDRMFSQGIYYSRRLLLNYYGNRLLLHTRFQEYEKAEYYGYLSIREKTSDYIFYVNNLTAVLMRQHKHQDALQLMRSAYPEMKTTAGFHNRIGFVALYLKCLNHNAQYRSAENYAESFLSAYRKEVFEYRWHIFFTSYLEALLRQEKYARILKIVRKHQLLEKEGQYRKNANYMPTILWYNAVASYKETLLSREQLEQVLHDSIAQMDDVDAKHHQLRELLEEVRPLIPAVINRLRERLTLP
ncbi:MAG: hypothetical protein KF852_02990 [Saprospiraceae bacterium]|nr:hypothetical protein [Saprospiraceae bacterium]